LLGELKAFGSKFTVLDPRADVFWGNQNDERHARRFVRDIIDRIAEETDGLCLMLYQPSRSGRQDGTGESGSVQWDAAFRASILLEGAKKDEETSTFPQAHPPITMHQRDSPQINAELKAAQKKN